MKRKAEGSLEGDTITKGPLLPPIGACILINIAAAALGMLPWGPGCELSTPPLKRPDVLETNASSCRKPCLYTCDSVQMKGFATSTIACGDFEVFC